MVDDGSTGGGGQIVRDHAASDHDRRPMLFFAYDLAHYRDHLRGFYFDREAEAPGPPLATSDEVVAALRDVAGVAAGYQAAYSAFAAKYCPLGRRKAAARVCDRLF